MIPARAIGTPTSRESALALAEMAHCTTRRRHEGNGTTGRGVFGDPLARKGAEVRHEDDEYEYQHDAQDAHEAGWRYTPGAYGGWWRKHHNEEDEYL
jgi:hypothetical protein